MLGTAAAMASHVEGWLHTTTAVVGLSQVVNTNEWQWSD